MSSLVFSFRSGLSAGFLYYWGEQELRSKPKLSEEPVLQLCLCRWIISDLFLHQYSENLVSSDSPQAEGRGRGKSTTNTVDIGCELGSKNYSG